MPLDSQQLLERFNAKMPPTGILFGTKVLEVDQAAGRVRMSFQIDERFCNPRRRHSKPGYLSPMEFETRAMLA